MALVSLNYQYKVIIYYVDTDVHFDNNVLIAQFVHVVHYALMHLDQRSCLETCSQYLADYS